MWDPSRSDHLFQLPFIYLVNHKSLWLWTAAMSLDVCLLQPTSSSSFSCGNEVSLLAKAELAQGFPTPLTAAWQGEGTRAELPGLRLSAASLISVSISEWAVQIPVSCVANTRKLQCLPEWHQSLRWPPTVNANDCLAWAHKWTSETLPAWNLYSCFLELYPLMQWEATEHPSAAPAPRGGSWLCSHFVLLVPYAACADGGLGGLGSVFPGL